MLLIAITALILSFVVLGVYVKTGIETREYVARANKEHALATEKLSAAMRTILIAGR